MKRIILLFTLLLSVFSLFAQKGANNISFGPTYARPFKDTSTLINNLVGVSLAYERGLNDYFGLRGAFGFESEKIDLSDNVKLPLVVRYRYYSFSPEIRYYPLGAKKTFYLGLMPKFNSINITVNNELFTDINGKKAANQTNFGLFFNAGYRKDFSEKLFLQLNIGVGNTGDELFSKKESHNYYTGNVMIGYKF
jgi:hypothetical protein